MREFGSSPSLGGSLLIAHPGLLDPNFRRTVVFLSTHSAEEGTFGLVINRPAGKTVSQLLPDRNDLRELASIPVLHGGPVAQDQLVFASFTRPTGTERVECRHHLSIEDAQEAARLKRSVVRAFVGYAGWTGGQLENELSLGGWLVKPAEIDLFKPGSRGWLWRELISTFGATFQLTAEAPENPSLN